MTSGTGRIVPQVVSVAIGFGVAAVTTRTVTVVLIRHARQLVT